MSKTVERFDILAIIRLNWGEIIKLADCGAVGDMNRQLKSEVKQMIQLVWKSQNSQHYLQGQRKKEHMKHGSPV